MKVTERRLIRAVVERRFDEAYERCVKVVGWKIYVPFLKDQVFKRARRIARRIATKRLDSLLEERFS